MLPMGMQVVSKLSGSHYHLVSVLLMHTVSYCLTINLISCIHTLPLDTEGKKRSTRTKVTRHACVFGDR